MLFNSYQFFIFFPIVTLVYFLLPHRMRWFMLLVASCVFYMAFIPIYIVVLFVTILIDYFAAKWIEKSEGKKRKLYLIISIISTCAVLFVFKYFNFFNNNISSFARFFHLNYPIGMLQIILPIGLSFHTFQSLSYVIEVYRKNQRVEHNFGIYALYVMFYPQLVAGPIERPKNLLHQFYEKHYFDYKRISDGLKLMAWGFFKKVVIADRLAAYVNVVYDNPSNFQGVSLIEATIFFAFQIYCDFSGYSDIAIGSAQVMGFKLMDNFNRPYFSKSISEFWKRWHISLSSWFRDYLYIPLGGNRVSKGRIYFNLFVTFLVSGLWHGANWTYIVWGGLNGFYVILEIVIRNSLKKFNNFMGLNKIPKVNKYIKIFVTFLLTCFAWIFFRAKNIKDAFYIISHLFSGIYSFCSNLIMINTGRGSLYPIVLGFGVSELIISLGAILFLMFIHFVQRHGSIRHMLSERTALFRWTCYCLMVSSIIIFGSFESPRQFIYFQF